MSTDNPAARRSAEDIDYLPAGRMAGLPARVRNLALISVVSFALWALSYFVAVPENPNKFILTVLTVTVALLQNVYVFSGVLAVGAWLATVHSRETTAAAIAAQRRAAKAAAAQAAQGGPRA